MVGPTTPILCKTMLSICKRNAQFEGVLDTDKKSLLYLQQHPEKTTYVTYQTSNYHSATSFAKQE
jgi:hypothetical protein